MTLDLTLRPGVPRDLLAPLGAGPWTVLPTGLAVATRADGSPDLLLELVRPERPLPGRDDAYAMLDVRLAATHRVEEGLAAARAVDPAATVVPATLARGWLRFATAGDLDMPEELTQPVALGFRALTGVRWVMRLSATGGLLLRGMLHGGAVPLGAVAQFGLHGIAPRVPLRARASRAELLAALIALAGGAGHLTLGGIKDVLQADPSRLGFELHGDSSAVDAAVCAQVLCDLVVAELGTLAPGAGQSTDPVLLLAAPDPDPGVIDRDLREPFETVRPLVLTLDPLAAARSIAGPEGAPRLVRETVTSRFDAGRRALKVLANLPANRVGLLAVGARVTKEPAPPSRVQAVAAVATFAEPGDEDEVLLRLAPREAPDVDVEGFAVVPGQHGVRELRGPSRREGRPLALLGPEEFPLRFVRVAGSPGLLAIAEVAGRCVHGTGADEVAIGLSLTAAEPVCSVALPAEVTVARLELELLGPEGTAPVRLSPLPASDLVLDLAAVPEFGSHEVLARCRFTGDLALHAIDVVPEGAPADRAPQVVTFTPAQPERTIKWFARSPFRPGFRHRPHAAPGAPLAPWSEPHPPFKPLELAPEVAA